MASHHPRPTLETGNSRAAALVKDIKQYIGGQHFLPVPPISAVYDFNVSSASILIAGGEEKVGNPIVPLHTEDDENADDERREAQPVRVRWLLHHRLPIRTKIFAMSRSGTRSESKLAIPNKRTIATRPAAMKFARRLMAALNGSPLKGPPFF